MKRIFTLFLVLLILLNVSCSYKEESSATINVNEKIVFGHQNGKPLTWITIYDHNHTKILLSEKILDVKKYNEKEEKHDWDKTTLYEYLNSDFVNEHFTSEEKDKMTYTNDVDNDLVTMLTLDNLLDLYDHMNYVKDGYYGDKDYFAANDKIVAKPSELALYNEIDVFDNEVMAQIMRTEVDHRYDFANGCAGYWILNQLDDVANAYYVTPTGYIGNTPVNTDYIGIRPVIRIKS